jgi:hypothetical protein
MIAETTLFNLYAFTVYSWAILNSIYSILEPIRFTGQTETDVISIR